MSFVVLWFKDHKFFVVLWFKDHEFLLTTVHELAVTYSKTQKVVERLF